MLKIRNLNIGEVVWVTLKDANNQVISFSPTGCANDAKTFALTEENEDFEKIFRGLTLAKGTDASITLWLVDCYTHHNGKIRPEIRGVTIW